MPDLPIALLPEITGITTDTLFVVSDGGTTYKVKAGNTSGDAAHGQFLSTVDQFITGTTSQSYIMSADTVIDSEGVTVVDGSKFTFLSGGTYNFSFSSQLIKTTGAGAYTISIWLNQNGNPIIDSTGDVVLAGTPISSPLIAAWTYLLTVESGDNVELVWSSDVADVKLYAIPIRSNPSRPTSPSVSVIITQL
jgi:hypothetical protein